AARRANAMARPAPAPGTPSRPRSKWLGTDAPRAPVQRGARAVACRSDKEIQWRGAVLRPRDRTSTENQKRRPRRSHAPEQEAQRERVEKQPRPSSHASVQHECGDALHDNDEREERRRKRAKCRYEFVCTPVLSGKYFRGHSRLAGAQRPGMKLPRRP